MAKSQLDAVLTWTGGLTFTASSDSQTMTVDGDGAAGPSPMQTLAFSIAGCMAMDVAEILMKGRHPLDGLEVRFTGRRADNPPRRYTAITLTFIVRGADVPADAVRRAIALSQDKYCSVSNSLRGDIELITEYEVRT